LAAVPLSVAGETGGATEAESESWSKTTGQWFENIEPGGTVRVVNPFGDVYARFGGYENRVEVLATLQRSDVDQPELEVRLSRAGPGLDVGVAAGAADTGEADLPAPTAQRRDRADLVVFVPLGAVLDARTTKGRIDVKGLEGELIAGSTSGDIRVRSVDGRVRAKSSRGRISVAFESDATEEPQELTTETGEIEAYLWEDADLRVRIATSGEISTDFSIDIEHHRFEEPGKHAAATIGRGGPGLTLRSKRGAVRLLRLQRDFSPAEETP
jgi:hypothetical protein